MSEPLLSVEGLVIEFGNAARRFPVVNGIDLTLDRGRTLGLVGESGCGKSVASLAVMRLIPQPQGHYAAGRILFEGRDLLSLPGHEMRKLRGGQIGMVFQEPMTSLNPVYTLGAQLQETLQAHSNLSRRAARDRALELLDMVGLPSPVKRIDDYPHQISGGQRQRVMIAMALANDPALLIADEPTTALDVTIQAQILELLQKLQERTGAAILLITHDLGVVAETCDEVAVMYAGSVVERASTRELFADPQHPYTIGLMAAIPRLDVPANRLMTIPGAVPPPWERRKGCRFSSRCPLTTELCEARRPSLTPCGPGHSVSCWRAPIEETPI